VSTNAKTFLTPEQYLEIERKAEFKSEYYQGEMFAMAGASLEHNQLVAAVVGELGQQLRHRPCQVLPSDMRVAIRATGMYAYPDATVCCGEPQLLDGQMDTLLNPAMIVEVLSRSTEGYNRGEKFDHYKTIESLTAYLLVSSDRVHLDLFMRSADGRWTLASADGREDVMELPSIGCKLALADLYERVEFGEQGPGSRPLAR
jgi:Uma2 family endonuclease